MTITAPETTQERFSARLKESTKHVHDNAEHSTFMEDLMGGSLNTEAYLRLINQYVHIYEALEAVSEHYRAEPSPITEPFTHPGLDRAEYIRADIRALGQDGDIDAPLPATAEYVERIRATITPPNATWPTTTCATSATSPAARQSQRWSPATTASPQKR